MICEEERIGTLPFVLYQEVNKDLAKNDKNYQIIEGIDAQIEIHGCNIFDIDLKIYQLEKEIVLLKTDKQNQEQEQEQKEQEKESLLTAISNREEEIAKNEETANFLVVAYLARKQVERHQRVEELASELLNLFHQEKSECGVVAYDKLLVRFDGFLEKGLKAEPTSEQIEEARSSLEETFNAGSSIEEEVSILKSAKKRCRKAVSLTAIARISIGNAKPTSKGNPKSKGKKTRKPKGFGKLKTGGKK